MIPLHHLAKASRRALERYARWQSIALPVKQARDTDERYIERCASSIHFQLMARTGDPAYDGQPEPYRGE